MTAIAHIAESFAYGTARSVVQLCQSINGRGTSTIYYGVRQGTDVELQSLPDSVKLKPLPGRGAARHLINMRFLAKELKQYQIVHGHSSYGGLYAKAWGRKTNSTVLYSPRGYAFLREDLSRPVRWAVRKFEKTSARWCTTVGCGPYEYQLASELGGPATCINNGFIVTPPTPASQLNRTVLGVGRICQQKGFDIFRSVAQQLPAVPFTWVGDVQTADQSEIANLPANLKLQTYMTHENLLQLIRDSRIIFLPSRWEGLSRFLIESVCLSKAIVTSRFPGNMDCLDAKSCCTEYGNGFACQSETEYIHAITRLVDDDHLLDQKQSASFQHASQHFDIDVIMAQWRKLYESVR
ncbi:MAG: glycosyltransferase family 4 protein [Planctomycetota bacterium]